MPIDPKYYPPHWKELSLSVREDANWTCETCGKPCLRPGESVEELAKRLDEIWLLDLLDVVDSEEFGEVVVPVHGKRFVLTTAHLDQNTENNKRHNLKALCAVCHLNYDRPYKQSNALRKRERLGQLNVFKDIKVLAVQRSLLD